MCVHCSSLFAGLEAEKKAEAELHSLGVSPKKAKKAKKDKKDKKDKKEKKANKEASQQYSEPSAPGLFL